MSNDELDEYRFMGLVEMLSQSAMMALGKVAHPGTGQTAIDLNQAQAMIELLTMLEKRTKGNLGSRESGFLTMQLTNLRLNYLDVSKNPAATAAAAAARTAAAAEEDEDEDDSDEDDDEDEMEATPAPQPEKAPSKDEKPSEGSSGGYVDKRSSRS